jgi:vitamin B12 transporter
MRNPVTLLLLLFAGPLLGQGGEAGKILEELEITAPAGQSESAPNVQKLSKEQLQALQPEDAGQLLQKFAGVSLKSYGGLGGMKTISVRGIGGSHTGLVVDGFLLQNSQTGQIDLGTIQAENIESIALSIGGTDGQLLPVSAYLGGSALSIQTFENRFSVDTLFQVRATAKTGSFGQADGYLSLKYSRGRFFTGIFAKYRRADGTYPYHFENGIYPYNGKRVNNDLRECSGGFSMGFRPTSRTILKVNYQLYDSERGLPGAVILYNPTADQRLNNQSHQLNADFKYIGRNLGIRTYVSGRYEALQYIDSSYLNLQGFLDQKYYNASVQHGVSLQTYKDLKGFAFLGGVEQNYSTLHSSIPNFAQPVRYHLKSVAGVTYTYKKLLLLAQLGEQSVFDNNRNATSARDKHVFTPYFLLNARDNWSVFGLPRLWGKRTFRMPTFNELYYNQIGNTDLKPEIANQLDLGTTYALKIRRHSFTFNADGYYNLVENKIVAIPTKNLFIWSMQNVGLVQILGTDLQTTWQYTFKAGLQLDLRFNYTYQDVRDISDRNSPTYGDQLPYLPQHSGNADLMVSFRKTGCSISGFLTSERFALNENNASNQVDGFQVFDASVFHTFSFGKGQQLRVNFTVKNISDQSYAFVRYYVMPGRNYLISLNYALH